jgi:hypothetical protein
MEQLENNSGYKRLMLCSWRALLDMHADTEQVEDNFRYVGWYWAGRWKTVQDIEADTEHLDDNTGYAGGGGQYWIWRQMLSRWRQDITSPEL